MSAASAPIAHAGGDRQQYWGRSGFRTDLPLPPILLLSDLAAILEISKSRSHALEHAGEFRRFELLPRLGNKARYSGDAFEAWLRRREVPEVPAPAPAPPGRRPHLSAARRLRMARKP